jgi:hypothetical protein
MLKKYRPKSSVIVPLCLLEGIPEASLVSSGAEITHPREEQEQKEKVGFSLGPTDWTDCDLVRIQGFDHRFAWLVDRAGKVLTWITKHSVVAFRLKLS